MSSPFDPVELAAELIRCPSVTPARGEVFDVLENALKPLGFEVHRWVMGEPPDGPTENMVAIRGSGSPHFGFAGHVDVVPPGEGWSIDPFEGRIEDGFLDATTLMEFLIAQGLPMRSAHESVGKLVRLSEERGCRLAELPAEVKGLTRGQRDWQAKLDADYVLHYYALHKREAEAKPRPAPDAEEPTPLFPPPERDKPLRSYGFAEFRRCPRKLFLMGRISRLHQPYIGP